MKTIHLTRSRTENMIRRIINEKGHDFVYQPPDGREGNGCVYVHQGEPSCLIAVLLCQLGVPVKALAECGAASELLTAHLVVDGPRYEFEISWEPGMLGFLDAIQEAQDGQMRYGHLPMVGEAYWRGVAEVGRRRAEAGDHSGSS